MRWKAAMTRNLTWTVVVFGLAAGTPAQAEIVWFDETAGGRGFKSFTDLAVAHDVFMGAPEAVVDFNDLPGGTYLPADYGDDLGLSFLNTASPQHFSSSRVWPEGNQCIEHVTGYDGSYMPDADMVYAKFHNSAADTPFTVAFAEPVSAVGAFVGMGVQGKVHSLTITLYDANDVALDKRTVQSWLWEKKQSQQNYESFFGVRLAAPLVSRVEILNDSTASFADSLIIDNLAFSHAVVPESATLLLLLAAGGLFLPRQLR